MTGGVYKARERIHRLPADQAITSDSDLHAVELQTAICTEVDFLRLAYSRELAALCTDHCSTCVALDIRAMRT